MDPFTGPILAFGVAASGVAIGGVSLAHALYKDHRDKKERRNQFQNGQFYYPYDIKQPAKPLQPTVQTYTQTMSHQKGGRETLGFTPNGGFLAIGMDGSAWSSGTISFNQSTSYETGPARSSGHPISQSNYQTIGRPMTSSLSNTSYSPYSQDLFMPPQQSWNSQHASGQMMIGYPGPPPPYYAKGL